MGDEAQTSTESERRSLDLVQRTVVSLLLGGVIAMVAGVLAPLVMGSTITLAIASMGLMLVGLFSWIYFHHRWPDIGRNTTQ